MAIVHVIVFAGGAILALVGSLVADLRLDTLARILLAGAWAGAVAVYFVMFWSTVGQTPGMRMMGVRLSIAHGRLPSVGRSLVRVAGLALATAPLFAGFLPVLVDDRRRGPHDFVAGTVVVHAGPELRDKEGAHPEATGARHIELAPAVLDDRQQIKHERSRA